MGEISLENMEFYAYHGHYDEEQKIGNRYKVNIKIDADLSKACKSDMLDDTIDYSRVYNIIKKEMQVPSKLLEHVAGRIIDAVYADFKAVEKITLKITKLNPPLEGKTEGVSITLSR